MIVNRLTKMVALLLMLAPIAMASDNEPSPTPIMTEFNIRNETPGGFVLGVALPLEGQPDARVGMALICDKANIEVRAFFGFYPVDIPVQMAVKSPDGKVWRHGRRELAGPQSGFHSPIITDHTQVEAFLQFALQRGSLISNGFNSFWNDLPDDINRQTRDRLLSCGQDQ